MKRLLTILIFSIVLPIQAINIKLLKGTHAIENVPSDYAPFWGLTFIECDIAQQWYTLSPKIVNKDIENHLQTIENPAKQTVLDLLKKRTNTGTENLVAQMFHITRGTFNITAAPDNPVRQLKPYDIGKILKMIHEALSNRKNNQLHEKLNGDKPNKLKNLIRDYLLKIKNKNEEPLKGLDNKPFKSDDFNKFINPLIDALQESLGANALYPTNTAQGLLLGYMLAKANDKSELQDYFRGFLGNDSFELQTDEYDNENFKEIITKNDSLDLKDMNQFGDYICAMTYNKYNAKLPKIVANSSVNYQGVPFSDCVETTMRNLANIVTYDMEQSKLGIAPQGITMDAQLTKFYQTNLNSSIAEVGNINVHQAWSGLIENQVGICYANLLDPKSKKSKNIEYLSDGVILVDTLETELNVQIIQVGDKNHLLHKKKIGNQTFLLLQKDSDLMCYEMMPSAANIVATMNRLFNLNLYQSNDAILMENFASLYFKSMCEKLGWSVTDDVIETMKKSRSLNFQVTLNNSHENFTIHLYDKEHGYISIEEKQNQSPLLNITEVFDAHEPVQAALVALGQVPTHKILTNKILQRYIPVSNKDQRIKLISNLVPVVTDENASYLAQLLYSFSTESDPYYINTIASLLWTHENIGKIPSISNAFFTISVCSGSPQAQAAYAYINNSVDDTHVQGLLNCISNSIINAYLKNDSKKITKIMALINKAILSTNVNTQIDSIGIAESLILRSFINSKNVSQVFELISIGMKSTNHETQTASLSTLQSLTIENLINSNNIPQVLACISIGMQSTNYGIQTDSLNTLRSLITKKLIDSNNIPQVFELISTGIQSTNHETQTASLSTLRSLITKNLIDSNNIPQVFALISTGMKSTNPETQTDSLYTLEYLITKNLIDSNNIPQVLAWISTGMKSTNPETQTDSLYTLQSLITKNLIDSNNIPQALALIDTGIQSQNSQVSQLASSINKTIEKLQ